LPCCTTSVLPQSEPQVSAKGGVLAMTSLLFLLA